MSAQPIRNHIIPEFILANFTDARDRVFVFDKRRPDTGIRDPIPKEAFVQKNLNTFFHPDGRKDYGLETRYAELEGKVGLIVQKIIQQVRKRNLPNLTIEDRNTFDKFAVHQHKRAPDAYERLGLHENIEPQLIARIHEYERDIRMLTDEEREQLLSPIAIKRIRQNATVVARGSQSEEALATLAQRGIAIAYISAPNKSFIIGDHPQARMGADGYLGNPKTEFWFPISSDIAVSPWGKPMTEALYEAPPRDVRRINKIIFEQSNIVAARSEALIKSLAGLKSIRH